MILYWSAYLVLTIVNVVLLFRSWANLRESLDILHRATERLNDAERLYGDHA